MSRLFSTAPRIASVMILLGVLSSGAALAEVGDKRAKCAEGIGCSDASPPKSPPAKKPETQTPRTDPHPERSTSNDGAGRIRQDSPTTRAQSDVRQRVEECSNRQQQGVDYQIGARQRISNPELNASQCIRLGNRKGLYGPGFVNTCQHPVQFKFCAYRSRPGSWEEAFDCEKTKGGTELIQPGQSIAAHTSNAEHFYWAGCKFPEGTPADFKFTAGRGYEFRCYAWGDTTEQAARSWQTAECNTTELVKKAEKRLADEKAVAAAQAIARQRAMEQKPVAARQEPRPSLPTPHPLPPQLVDPCQTEWMRLDAAFDSQPDSTSDAPSLVKRGRNSIASRLEWSRRYILIMSSAYGGEISYEQFRDMPSQKQVNYVEGKLKGFEWLFSQQLKSVDRAFFLYLQCTTRSERDRALKEIQNPSAAIDKSPIWMFRG